MLMQMILENDEEVLTSKTLWSDRVLQERAQHVRQHDGHAGDHAGAARRSATQRTDRGRG